jgi:HTH-type transcriptional regulator / antitoxin HigA
MSTAKKVNQKVKIVHSEVEYQKALSRLDELFDAPMGTSESDEADLWALVIEDYESKYHVIDAPDPIHAIRIRMEEMQLKQNDLLPIFGSKSRISEVLNRKRKLTLNMIRQLHEKLNLSLELLVKDYQLVD